MSAHTARYGEFRIKYDPIINYALPRLVEKALDDSPHIVGSPLMGSPGFFVVYLGGAASPFGSPDHLILILGDYHAVKTARHILVRSLSRYEVCDGAEVTAIRSANIPPESENFLANIPYRTRYRSLLTEDINNFLIKSYYVLPNH